jgi:hypothetical protein
LGPLAGLVSLNNEFSTEAQRTYCFDIDPKDETIVQSSEHKEEAQGEEEVKKKVFNPKMHDWSIHKNEPLEVLKIYQKMYPNLVEVIFFNVEKL